MAYGANPSPAPGGRASIDVSVVVPSVNGLDDLSRTLAALEAEESGLALETIVVDRLGDAVRDAVRARFPGVRIVAAAADASIPAMRGLAFDLARGEYVAVIEDHVIVPPRWAHDLVSALREAEQTCTPVVVGGAVENAATERVVDWAAFLCEYSHCLPPLPAGPTTWLTGNNVLYPRVLLDLYRVHGTDDQWEDQLHARMRAGGVTLLCCPGVIVSHRKHYTVREYLSQRFLYSRSYAGARWHGVTPARRALLGAASLALPAVLLSRIVTRVASKRRHVAPLLRGLPLIALFVLAWAAGEVAGAWFGAGNSLRKVR